MLNGSGNKSNKKINMLCCCFVGFFSPKVQVAMEVVNVIFGIGLHVRGGCMHVHRMERCSHDNQNFLDL